MLTPRLIPWTWTRWLVGPLTMGTVGLCAWWSAVVWLARTHAHGGGVSALPEQEAARMLAWVAAVLACTSVALEGRLTRSPAGRRVWAALLGGVLAGLLAWGLGSLTLVVQRASGMPEVTLALRWRLGPWVAAGLAMGLGALLVRVGRQALDRLQLRWELPLLNPPPVVDEPAWATWVTHTVGASASAGQGAVVWYAVGILRADHFLASAVAMWCWGAAWGALAVGWPDRLVQGWVVVQRGARPGWRVPLEASDPVLAERFLGSFPAGLDLVLPESDGIAELHLSVRALPDGQFAARGLSVQPVRLLRAFERVDLRYDPGLSAPFETPLEQEDRIRLGTDAEVELVVLSREGLP